MLRKFNPAGSIPSPAHSHGVEATSPQRIVYVSGQVGVKPDGSVPEGVGPQTTAAIANLNRVLADAGMGAEDIAKMTIYLTDDADLPGFMQAGGPELPSPPPATTLLIVKALASPALKIEIEAVAVR